VLAELDAFFTAQLATSASFTMFCFYFLSVWAVIVVMVNASVLRRLFDRGCVIWRYFSHQSSFLILLSKSSQAGYINGA
jgi:hypothetical protein